MNNSAIPPTPTQKDYTEDPVYKAQAEANAVEIFDYDEPYALFNLWMHDARKHELNDSNAMSLATVDDHGAPDVRIILLKGVSPQGFVFYSNKQSCKGQHLKANKNAALCFHWKSLRRQVRVRGMVEPVSDDEADNYFAARARGSQIGAWASQQSQPLESRAVFEDRLRATEAEFKGQDDVPRPPFWGGWRIIPTHIEFWRDRPYRLHDRLVFTKDGSGWHKERLFP